MKRVSQSFDAEQIVPDHLSAVLQRDERRDGLPRSQAGPRGELHRPDRRQKPG